MVRNAGLNVQNDDLFRKNILFVKVDFFQKALETSIWIVKA